MFHRSRDRHGSFALVCRQTNRARSCFAWDTTRPRAAISQQRALTFITQMTNLLVCNSPYAEEITESSASVLPLRLSPTSLAKVSTLDNRHRARFHENPAAYQLP